MILPFLSQVIAALVLSLFVSAGAHAAASEWVGDDRAAVRIITAVDAAGDAASLGAGIEFRFGSGWHGAWRSPGDAGFAPKIDWSGSEGIGTPELAWPAPHRLSVNGLETFVYDGGVVLPLRLPRTGNGPVRLHVNVRHATCGEICVPYRASLDLVLPQGPARPSAEAGLIATARLHVPGPPDAAGFEVTGIQLTGGQAHTRLELALASRTIKFLHPDLFIEGATRDANTRPVVTVSGNGRKASFSVDLPPDLNAGRPLSLTLVDASRSAEIAFIPQTTSAWSDIAAVLVTALLGGLVLNAMPCVLPVLSLKAFALTRYAGAERGAIRAGLLATAGGILVSFLVIALALIVLKISGARIGWGIQFQDPWFLAAMALLTALFAASLFEWVTIRLPAVFSALGGSRGAHPLAEAFLTGAFATLLATPCSAPFLGSAIGFALTRGWPDILIVFGALGVGMALPFLLLAAKPSFVRWLPQPGPWMQWLRFGLGLLLLATVLWLLTVLAEVTSTTAAAFLFGFLTLLLVWLSSSRYGLARSGVIAAIVAAILMSVQLIRPPDDGRDGPWQAFAPDAIPGLVAQGQVVIVDTTASWCLTCRLNEISTLNRAEVRGRLSQPGVVAMRADWTNPDPRILSLLESFGRFGIPLVAVYGPGLPAGTVLPEILTPGIVVSALGRAAGPIGNAADAAVHH